MKIATRIASACPLARTALTLPEHGGVADDAATLADGVGRILAPDAAHAREIR